MRSFVKRTSCLVIVMAMTLSVFGCGKSEKKKKKEELVKCAETVMEALIKRQTKALKKCGEFSEETLDRIDALSDSDVISAVMKKATYTIDESSVQDNRKTTSCKVNVLLPDYAAAVEEADSDPDAFADAIGEQKTSKYKTVELVLKFQENEESYTFSNGDNIVDKLYGPMTEALAPLMVSGGEPGEDPTDPSQTQNAPTSSYPVVYEDSNVSIRFMNLDSDGVHLEVWNNTGDEVRISAKSLAINRHSVNDIEMHDKVDAHSLGEIVAECDIDASMTPGTISGKLRIGTHGYADGYYVVLEEVVIDASVTVDPPVLEGTLLYENDEVRMAYKEVRDGAVILDVENRSNRNIQVQTEALALNGRCFMEIQYFSDEDVAPFSIGEVEIPCDSFMDLEEAGTISGHFSIYQYIVAQDKNESFEFWFDTVVIDDTVTVENAPEGVLIQEKPDQVNIYYKEVTDEGVVLDVENLTEYPITFVPDCIAINGSSYSGFFCSEQLAPHSLCNVVVPCDHSPDNPVAGISGFFRVTIIMGEGYDEHEILRFSISYAVIDDSISVEKIVPEGPLLYEDHRVKIYFYGVTEDGIAFEVENCSNITLAMQCDDLSVNGNHYQDNDIIMSDQIAPHSIGIAVAKVDFPDDTVQKIGGVMRIVDISEFTSYDATMENVTIG
ncbi:MAG: hypothetical protein J5636_06515 [Clostridiales bacterium]|nr:hypothetical protein [Clostridiales bacterium]